jgi:hypothetical protein
MRSMWWQPGKFGTTSAFAFRPRETKKKQAMRREMASNEVINAGKVPSIRSLLLS